MSSQIAQRLQLAQACKEEGNASLRGGNVKQASFNYKRACLYLAEYVPAGMAAKTAISGGTGGADDNAGLVALLGGQKQGPSSLFDALSPREQCAVIELYGTTQNNLALTNLRLERLREGVACATCVLEQLVSFLPKVEGRGDDDADEAELCENITRVRQLFENNAKALLRRASCFVGLADYGMAEKDLQTLEALAKNSGTAPDVGVAELRARMDANKKKAAQREKKMMQKLFE